MNSLKINAKVKLSEMECYCKCGGKVTQGSFAIYRGTQWHDGDDHNLAGEYLIFEILCPIKCPSCGTKVEFMYIKDVQIA